jgi:hypothetical protein
MGNDCLQDSWGCCWVLPSLCRSLLQYQRHCSIPQISWRTYLRPFIQICWGNRWLHHQIYQQILMIMPVCQANHCGQWCQSGPSGNWETAHRTRGNCIYWQPYSKHQHSGPQEGRRDGATCCHCVLKPQKTVTYSGLINIQCYLGGFWHLSGAWWPKVKFPWLHLQGCIPKTVFWELHPPPSKVHLHGWEYDLHKTPSAIKPQSSAK